MPPVGFKPTISAGERPQTYALDRAATGTGFLSPYNTEDREHGRKDGYEETRTEKMNTQFN
jgi:hypothetical protein